MKVCRRPIRAVLALILLAVLLPGSAAFGEGANLIANGSFEELDPNGFPSGWTKGMYNWDEGVTLFDIVQDGAHEGRGSARIRSYGDNDARLEQKVECKPNTVYRLSGWVRAENVPQGSFGVNLSIENLFVKTDAVTGTSGADDWSYVEMYGMTGPAQYELNVYARLGFYGDTITGTAYFDDIRLEEAEDIPSGAAIMSFDAAPPEPQAAKTESPNYTAAIIIIALGFMALFAAAMHLRSRNNLPDLAAGGHAALTLGLMLAIAFIVRLLISVIIPGYSNDIACWKGWGARMLSVGPWNFYSDETFCDYPPGYMYVLGLMSLIKHIFNVPYDSMLSEMIVKLPAMICDIIMAMLIYKWARREKISEGGAVWLAAFYALNPAAIFDSAAWGQIDSLLTLMLFIAIYYCAKGRWIIALPVYLTSALVKPQALMLAPLAAAVLITEIIRAGQKRGKLLAQLGKGLLIAIAAALLIIAPVWGGQKWDWLISKYTATLSSYNYASINALNIYQLFGLNWVSTEECAPLGLPLNIWSYIVMGISIAYSVFLYVKSRDARTIPLVCALMLMLLFNFTIKMHERYLFPAIMLLALGYMLLKDRRLLMSAALISATQFVNMGLVLQSVNLQPEQRALNVIVALVNAGIALYACAYAWDICVRGNIKTADTDGASAGLMQKLSVGKRSAADIDADMTLRIAGKSNYRLGMKAIDYAIIGAVTLSYAAVAFMHLGTMSAPQTEWISSMPDETVTIDLGEKRTFDFMYYGGITNGAFSVAFSDDGQNWSEEGQAEYGAGKIFQWLRYRETMKTEDGGFVSLVNGYPKHEARYIRLRFEMVGFKMREIGFLDAKGHCYPIASIKSENYDSAQYSDPIKLIDEQNTVPAEPSYYNSMYFDEIYHARTAYEHLHGLHTYEWTHPPLGKVLMMIGISIFGMCPFGWRFMGALTGVLMVPIMYLLTKQLFKRRDLATFTTVLMTFDCMHFTQTRLATIDSYGVLFIMVMYLFMFRYMQMSFFRDDFKRTLIPLGLSGLFMGIGCASKWIDIYAAAGLAVLFFATMFMRYNEYRYARRHMSRLKRRSAADGPYEYAQKSFAKYLIITLALCCIFFIAVPALIYYLSYYWQLKPDGGLSLGRVWSTQQSMLHYHAGLTNDTHPFSAPWYTWPLILKPIYYYSGRDFMPEGMYSVIWCTGNPAVWWPMLVGMLFTIALCIYEKGRDRKKLIVIVSFLAQYLPWVLVPRSMFIYHYFASIPFMIMSICFVIKAFEKRYPRATHGIAAALMAIAIGIFILFYPVMSGVPCTAARLSIINKLGPWNFY